MKYFYLIIAVLLMGCAATPPVKSLDAIDRHVNHIYTQCQMDALNFPIFYREWKREVEPQLLNIIDLSFQARKEQWTDAQIRTVIIPKVGRVHNQVYQWGMRIVETPIP